MSEPLKNQFGKNIPKKLAQSIEKIFPKFQSQKFIKDCLKDYEKQNLMQRGKKIAKSLHKFLPKNYPQAVKILVNSMDQELSKTHGWGMTPFFYLPHSYFISLYGLEHFELSMQAQYQLTKRFTAEFSIRAFLIRYPKKTLAHLKIWATDPNVHVRRLVSEGTRPRLPWAIRLPEFQKNPRPTLKLLELLKDDSEIYVRRSVANHLNDIWKDNPDLAFITIKRWLKNPDAKKIWIAKKALRNAIKSGDPKVLALFGYKKSKQIFVKKIKLSKNIIKAGEDLFFNFELQNKSKTNQQLNIDFIVYYCKANKKLSPKVFKLKSLNLAAKSSICISKKISFKKISTRKFYSGNHKIDLLINGEKQIIGKFFLQT